jgi:type IV pilus assembly protein PilV
MTRSRQIPRSRGRQRGISLLEVLITIIIMAFGLLGLALLQTMNLRYTQSANYRTVATNLSYEVLDLVRVNNIMKRTYAETGYVSGGTPTACNVGATFDPTANIARWHCEVSQALPGGESQISVVGNVATVRVRWTDARWEALAADQRAEFVLVVTL